jgi:glycosyltransferase involved in cell wall biosynthesis
VIYNGIDVSRYEPSYKTPSGPLSLVTVGALAPRKGQEYVIEALKLVDAAGVSAKLVLVGSGADEAMLQRVAAGSGVGDLITFAGEHADPRPFLSSADVFVLPSRQEGFSNAILEAMAAALPVIATDVGGNAEAIVQGQGGLIVEPGKPDALAAAIIELDRNRLELNAMGRFNRERVVERFSLEGSARSLADWYFRRTEVIRAEGRGASALH